MFDTVQKHSERIEALEEQDRRHDERLKRLEDQAIKLENTVMAENRETRATVVEQNRQLFTLIEGVMGFKQSEASRDHEYRLLKWDKSTAIVLKVMGAGGIMYLIVQSVLGG